MKTETSPFANRLPRSEIKKSHVNSVASKVSKAAKDDAYLKKVIRDINLKVTDQRLLILQALHNGRDHVTAQEVFENVLKVDTTVGFATVYRFLRALTESGYTTEVRMGGLPARYELTPQEHHDHLSCTECGKIVEFENPDIELLQEKVAQHFGFILTGHLLELYGKCSDCNK